MNQRWKSFFDMFLPMNNKNEAESIEVYELEEVMPTQNGARNAPFVSPTEKLITFEERLRDWGALAGFMNRSKEESWKIIADRFKSQLSLLEEQKIAEEIPDTDGEEGPRENSEGQLRIRLEEIKKRIAPTMTAAKEQGDRLRNMGMMPEGARVMVWIGWMAVAVLGWFYSLILQEVIEQPARAESSATNAVTSVNDIIALFVLGFAEIKTKILEAYPSMSGYEWIFPTLGIVLIIVAITCYLMYQRSSGDLKSIENALDIIAHGSPTPDTRGPGKKDKKNRKSQRLEELQQSRRSRWLMLAVIFGLPGFGLLLSSIQKNYSLSMILIGYVMAALSAGVMMLVIHYSMGESLKEDRQLLPDWLVKTIVIATLTLFGLIFIGLFLQLALDQIHHQFPRYLVIFALGCFLLGGMAVLAVGTIHKNIYNNESYWMRVEGQLDRRLRNIERQKARRIESEEKNIANLEDTQWKEKSRIETDLGRFKTIYEQAYEIGSDARILREQRLNPVT